MDSEVYIMFYSLSGDTSIPSVSATSPMDMARQVVSRLHLDFAGHIDGRMYIVLVNTHLKWMDVVVMS